MELLYIAALVFGAGALAVQLFMGDGDDGDGAEPDASGDGAGQGVASAALFVLSLRFWVFAGFAFGLTGTLLYWFGLASPLFTLALSLAAGLAAGSLAAWVFRALARAEASTGVVEGDLIGQVGRVLVPIEAASPGKVRLELRGQIIDMLASADGERIGAGELVLVQGVNAHVLEVVRAPAELLPAAAAPRLPGA